MEQFKGIKGGKKPCKSAIVRMSHLLGKSHKAVISVSAALICEPNSSLYSNFSIIYIL